jgi:glycosyltransferase involved in cell wall biosynthesis
LDIIICGQILSGRIEVLESYLKERTNYLAVFGYPGANSPDFGRCTIYKRNRLFRKSRMLFNRLKIGAIWHIQPLIFVGYIMGIFSSLYSALRLGKKVHIFVGVGSFATFVGIILKKIGLVQFLIFYSIDYFSPSVRTITAGALRPIDRHCAISSDIVWSISPRILEARYLYSKLPPENYTHIIVPVGFDSRLLNRTPLDGFERWTLAFVGTSGPLHGLKLLVEAMPLILKRFPEVKVKLFGPGPWDDIKKLVTELHLQDSFIFMGFIHSEDKLFESISRCAAGIALYTDTQDNPAIYADPGKPKLYAFCGLPNIITKTPQVAYEIDKKGAGIAIDYNIESLVSALIKLLEDEKKLKKYRLNAIHFAESYTSERIFTGAFQKTLNIP